MKKLRILLLNCPLPKKEKIHKILLRTNMNVTFSENHEKDDIERTLEDDKPEFILYNLSETSPDNMNILKILSLKRPDIPVIILITQSQENIIFACSKIGFFHFMFWEYLDYLPFAIKQLQDNSSLKKELEILRRDYQDSDKKFRKIFNHSNDAIFIHDLNGRFLDVNEVTCKRLGYSRNDMLNMELTDIYHPDFIHLIPKRIETTQRHKNNEYESVYRHKNGSSIPVHIKSTYIDDVSKPYIISVARDSTELLKTKNALMRSENNLRLLIKYSPAALAMFDTDMRYIITSRQYKSDYNLGDQHLIGRSHYEVFPEMPGRWKKIHRECLKGKVKKCLKDPFVRKDGSTDWVRWEIHPWYESSGEIGGIILFSEVITEQVNTLEELNIYKLQLEELVIKRTHELEEKAYQLARANIHLQEADQLKSIFLASMSHELRTPLNSIIGFTGILLMGLAGELNEEQKKQLTIVKSSGQHLLSLINDLLDISKIEEGKVDVFLTEFLFDDVLREAEETIKVQRLEKELKLQYSVESGLTLYTDYRRLKQLLVNLLSNAVKFTDSGSISIKALTEKENLRVSIADTGIGIRPEKIQNLFQPFQQLNSDLTKESEGTGLGLYLCQKLVTLLGGEIQAESVLGEGSTFSFSIPMKHKGNME